MSVVNQQPRQKWWADIHYFAPSEFDSPDVPNSGEKYMNEAFVKKLNTLRGLLKVPLIITSGYRTATYNNKIGGAPHSQHLKGLAADVAIAGEDAFKLVGLAYTLGFTGIGISQKGLWDKRFIHLDLRTSEPRIWSY